MPLRLTPGSIIGIRTDDRIIGMPKIKGFEIKRKKIYSSKHDPKIQLAHKEHTPKKLYSQIQEKQGEDM